MASLRPSVSWDRPPSHTHGRPGPGLDPLWSPKLPPGRDFSRLHRHVADSAASLCAASGGHQRPEGSRSPLCRPPPRGLPPATLGDALTGPHDPPGCWRPESLPPALQGRSQQPKSLRGQNSTRLLSSHQVPLVAPRQSSAPHGTSGSSSEGPAPPSSRPPPQGPGTGAGRSGQQLRVPAHCPQLLLTGRHEAAAFPDATTEPLRHDPVVLGGRRQKDQKRSPSWWPGQALEHSRATKPAWARA